MLNTYKDFYDRYLKIKDNVESDAFHKKVVGILSSIGFYTTLIKIDSNFNPVTSKWYGTIRKDNKDLSVIMIRIHFELPPNRAEFKKIMNSVPAGNRTPTVMNTTFKVSIKEKVKGITSIFEKQLNLNLLDIIGVETRYTNKTSPVTGVLTLTV